MGAVFSAPESGYRAPTVFLAHSKHDKAVAAEFFALLRLDGFRPWLDSECLPVGANWQREIENTVRNSDTVAVFLSASSIDRRGYVQREVALALDCAEQEPEGSIFVLPIRLDLTPVPSRLQHLHWLDEAEPVDCLGGKYLRLQHALLTRAAQLGFLPPSAFPVLWSSNSAGKSFIMEAMFLPYGKTGARSFVSRWAGGRFLVRGINPSGARYAGVALVEVDGADARMRMAIGMALYEYSGRFDGETLFFQGAHDVTYDARMLTGVLRGTWGEGGREELIPASPLAVVEELIGVTTDTQLARIRLP